MTFGHLIRYALTLKPGAAARGGWRHLKQSARGAINSARYANRCSFLPPDPDCQPSALLSTAVSMPPDTGSLARTCRSWLEHRFDLLGSGPVEVAVDGKPAGSDETHRFSDPAIDVQSCLLSQLNPGNRIRAAEVRKLISTGYDPIDWHIDFKSGYRWPANVVSEAIRYGHIAGVDIKVPWELARLQHLPLLAIAGTGSEDEQFQRELENQILDFIAANPPGWGVNWVCPMDIAIRAANMILAYDILRAAGRPLSRQFHGEFVASIRAHGQHVVQHLEWRGPVRGNHYLANIAGLTFVAAFLPSDTETNCWLAFSRQELESETARQFHDDGSNFEGSTCYHRLSAEFVTYATAVLLGLDDDRRRQLATVTPDAWPHQPPLQPPARHWSVKTDVFSNRHMARIQRMADFTCTVTKPDGRVVQIGDNDSGRFFKIGPVVGQPVGTPPDSLDHRALVAAIAGIIAQPEFDRFTGPAFEIESCLVRALTGRRQRFSFPLNRPDSASTGSSGTRPATRVTRTEIVLPDPALTEGLSTVTWPDFGLFIWRSERLFLSIRCGQIGQNGYGGHAHNDQLAIELQVDGKDWLADPGTCTYTADPVRRDAYRSVFAHATPRFHDVEPSSLKLGMFRLEDNANATVLRFDDRHFLGTHHAYRQPVFREIEIVADRIIVQDGIGGDHTVGVSPKTVEVFSGQELRDLFGLTLPFSAGYGLPA